MIAEILNSYRLTLDYLRRLVADVPDADFARQPRGVANHPAWIIGHLTYSCQAIGGELGLNPWLPNDWNVMFATGSVPTADRAAYPSKTELLAALEDGQQRLAARLNELGDQRMADQLPDENYRETFPTLGHAVLHILAGHSAVHVGQLSVWRRAAEYSPLGHEAV